jgi:hypothetical protein
MELNVNSKLYEGKATFALNLYTSETVIGTYPGKLDGPCAPM